MNTPPPAPVPIAQPFEFDNPGADPEAATAVPPPAWAVAGSGAAAPSAEAAPALAVPEEIAAALDTDMIPHPPGVDAPLAAESEPSADAPAPAEAPLAAEPLQWIEELEFLPPPAPKKTAGAGGAEPAAAPVAAADDEEEQLPLETPRQARLALEALLFSTAEPLSVARLSRLLNHLHPRCVRGLLLELQYEYDQRGGALQVAEVAGGFQLASRAHVAPWLYRLHRHRRRSPLSAATLETLAIVAYKQPATKGEVEAIRGVESSGTFRTLQDLNLIEASGRREVPGRPQLYVTTDHFLKVFGLAHLGDLPSIAELRNRFSEDQQLKFTRAAVAAAPAAGEPEEAPAAAVSEADEAPPPKASGSDADEQPGNAPEPPVDTIEQHDAAADELPGAEEPTADPAPQEPARRASRATAEATPAPDEPAAPLPALAAAARFAQGPRVFTTRLFEGVAPQALYAAWLDPAHFCHWLFATPEGEVIRAEADAREGGQFVLTDRRAAEGDIEHLGTYVELIENRRLAFELAVPAYTPEGAANAVTLIEVELRPTTEGTVLRLTHYGVDEPYLEQTEDGWIDTLELLAERLG